MSSGVSDEAVEVARIQIAYDALHEATCVNHGDWCRESEPQLKDAIRVMLWRLDEAKPLMSATPRPALDRAAVRKAIAEKAMFYRSVDVVGEIGEESLQKATDAIMALGRPLPTREQIKQALLAVWMDHKADDPEGESEAGADAVLALMGGAEK